MLVPAGSPIFFLKNIDSPSRRNFKAVDFVYVVIKC